MSVATHALLVTFPLDEASFISRSRARDVGDAVRFWSHKFSDSDAHALWPAYQKVARRIEEVCALSAEFGVRSVKNAQLSDLRQALNKSLDVTLLGHWKGARIFPFDIRNAGEVLARLGRSALGDALLLRQLIGANELSRMQAMSESDLGAAIVRSLNRIAFNEDLDPVGGRFDDDFDTSRHARNRAVLDAVLSPALQVGNRLELWDQMLDEPSFVSLVPRDRNAAIDLAVCHSAVFARRLQFTCDCPVVINSRPASVLFRLDLHFEAISLAARTGKSYVECVLKLRDALFASKRWSADPTGDDVFEEDVEDTQ